MKPLSRLLIANRGEIACRIIKTAQKMGIQTFAIASSADVNALYTHLADHVLYLKGDPIQSYLDQDQIIGLAKDNHIDAIHPGYGFLSENPQFARALKKAGIVFVGPEAESIEMMGLKDAAKMHVSKTGVKTVPGYYGIDQSDAIFKVEAKKTGYPILIKPIAGGGGKGMRICRNPSELLEALPSARREALSSFGDDRLLIEKYIENPRHIEVQILFDSFGNGVYLFERDCTLQRRHQKVIEEAPSHLSPELRAKIGAMALNAGKAANYKNAGTVECLYDPESGDLYFMEMNTRLQVEHPVTEAITGVDLVELQLRIARGEKLPLTQDDLSINGHAIEVRLYAEDPGQNFLPQTGKLLHLAFPNLPFVRIDTGVVTNDVISVHYDPMIAKIIVHGTHRSEALARAITALEATHVLGVKTNLSFLIALLKHPKVVLGDYATHFIEHHLSELQTPFTQETAFLACAALIQNRPISNSPFLNNDRFRLNSLSSEKIKLTLKGSEQSMVCTLHFYREAITCTLDDKCLTFRNIRRNGANYTLQTAEGLSHFSAFLQDQTLYLSRGGVQTTFDIGEADVEKQKTESKSGPSTLKAPMHGKVVKVCITKDQSVIKGETLMVMEAMKMEHLIKSPFEGTVSTLNAFEGDIIEEGRPLMTVTPKEAA